MGVSSVTRVAFSANGLGWLHNEKISLNSARIKFLGLLWLSSKHSPSSFPRDIVSVSI